MFNPNLGGGLGSRRVPCDRRRLRKAGAVTNPPDVPQAAAGAVPQPLAEWADRVVAWFMDFLLIAAAGIAVFIVVALISVISDTLGGLLYTLATLAFSLVWLYLGYLEGVRGQSPGKALQGLKVVKMADGQVLGAGMGIVRRIAHFIDGAICGLGYLLPLFDVNKQTIADKIVQTVVLKDQERRPLGQAIFLP